MASIKRTARAPVLASVLISCACAQADSRTDPRADGGAVGTAEQRAALFDTMYARVERREAFSTIKQVRLAYDPLAEMRALRDRVVRAETEVDLFYAIAAVGHARRDRHLDLYLVGGGLRPDRVEGLDVWGGEAAPVGQAPVRIFPDYGVEGVAYFVGDAATTDGPAVGDRVLSVNGVPVEEWHRTRSAFMRHSTEIGLKWKLAEAMAQYTAVFPPEMRSDELRLTTSGEGGEQEYALPYADPGALAWTGSGDPRYPGHIEIMTTPTFDLWLPTGRSDYLVLIWYGFRETMVADVDGLVGLAEEEGWLDRAVVMDVTRSRGGSLGAYAMQRLQPRPFRTTFGNLRLSDVIQPFIDEKRAEFEAMDVNDGGVPETIDDGTWLMEWLEEDVAAALERGDEYSNDVPFKLAHAPKDHDGTLRPAPVHFRGPLGIISGPQGGSHLDQFVSIVVDNGLGPVVGMPPGGYSNTWEWEEILTLPDDGRPLVGFMYNIGHSVRPNGEILEGNPAALDEWIPLTADNVVGYYPLLLDRALARMGVNDR